MPNIEYGPPSWLPTNWDKIKKDKAIQESIERASFFNAMKDWAKAGGRIKGESTTHEAAKAAGFTGDQAGAADLLLHYQLGQTGRWLNQAVDRGVEKNKYDDIRDSQIDTWNEQMGLNSSYGNLFQDVVNNPGKWELRPDPIQDNAQRKGLEGRRLYPKNPRGMGVLPSKKVSFGESVNKPQSKWEQSQELLSLRRREEEEERRKKFAEAQARQNQILQKYASRAIKPSIVPQKIWDAWVPSDGMSNYSIFDPSGGFKGLDADALMGDLFGGEASDAIS